MGRLLTAALVTLLLIPAAAGAYTPRERALYEDGPSGRYLLDQAWSTSSSQSGRFRPVSIPNVFNARDYTVRGNRSRVQWYRERFTLPRTPAAGWKLRFESVNVRADVWLNGRKIGSHVGAYLPLELSANGIRRGSNELLVRVDGRKQRDDIPPAGRGQGWWNYGGILREVYLRKVYAVNLGDPQVTTTIGDPAHVSLKAQVRGSGGDATVDVNGPNGFSRTVTVPVGELPTTGASIEVPGAQLWSPQNPALYVMKVTLPGGQVTTIHFGIRQWSKAPDGTPLLNGQPLRLRGASFHEDLLEPATIADELKALGANFTRQHYPPSPQLLEAFDRMGIVFWEQIPVWRLRGSDLTSRPLNKVILARLRQTLLRDRNHASVLTWSVENEVVRGGAQESRFLSQAKALTTRLDGTRYFAVDQTVTPSGKLPSYYKKLDALGISEYIGWYGTDPISDVRPAFDATRAQLPGVALFVTEFGAEANRAGPANVKGTYAFQSRWLDQQLTAIDATPYLGGAIVWLLRDYAVRPGWGGGNPRPSPPFSNKGLLNLQGKPKPAWSVAKSHFGLPSSTS
jgi:Glycosyl hydrolases family 2, TIM barrel domain/Glycosyl hydrolases family 2, sugar binding domain/Glycosyl hydrolases family 2